MKIVLLDIPLIEYFRNSIFNLLSEVYQLNFDGICNKDELINSKIDEIPRFIENGSAIILGALQENKMVGFLWAYEYVRLNEKCIHINHFIVDGKFRNKGIGKLLLYNLERESEKRGIHRIELLATVSNKEAINFYMRDNFEVERVYLKKNI